MTDPTGLEAGHVLPGDTILTHPDTNEPGEWLVTAVREAGPDRHVRLDYIQPNDTSGCLIVDRDQALTVSKGSVDSWIKEFTAAETVRMLCYLAGYCRDGMAQALAGVFGTRDLLAALDERHADTAVSAR